MPRRQQFIGFTLVEMLVVLILVSLTSVLLIQGTSQLLIIRDRVLEHTEYQREDVLRRSWFGETVGSLIADLETIDEHRFMGDESGFSGLTLAALTRPAGMPVRIEWRVETEEDIFRLLYAEQGGDWQHVWSWRPDFARFSYYSPESGWVAQWPPGGLGTAPLPLPALVMFETTWRGEPRTWLGAVQSSREVRPRLIHGEEFE